MQNVEASQVVHTDPPDGWQDMSSWIVGQRTFSLVFVFDRGSNRVLLGKKKRGFGAGLWNGFGGKMELGETARACAVRELREESSLEVSPYRLYDLGGIRISRISDGASGPIQIRLFSCEVWEGVPTEYVEIMGYQKAIDELRTDEMIPMWYDLDTLPYQLMWPEARVYLPLLLDIMKYPSSKRLTGIVQYDTSPADSGQPTLFKAAPDLLFDVEDEQGTLSCSHFCLE